MSEEQVGDEGRTGQITLVKMTLKRYITLVVVTQLQNSLEILIPLLD